MGQFVQESIDFHLLVCVLASNSCLALQRLPDIANYAQQLSDRRVNDGKQWIWPNCSALCSTPQHSRQLRASITATLFLRRQKKTFFHRWEVNNGETSGSASEPYMLRQRESPSVLFMNSTKHSHKFGRLERLVTIRVEMSITCIYLGAGPEGGKNRSERNGNHVCDTLGIAQKVIEQSNTQGIICRIRMQSLSTRAHTHTHVHHQWVVRLQYVLPLIQFIE